MQLIKLAAIPVIGLAAGLGLAACGSSTPTPAVTVTASPESTTPAPNTPAAAAPAPTVVIVKPAPPKTVYVQVPARAPTGLTACGEGVYAGPDTSCPFALNVQEAWSVSGATNYITAYSPVTGLSYTMYCSGDPVVCTGGNNALVQFNP